LESAIQALETKGDRRTLIGFVERWNVLGEPTHAARLAQARAFLDLCMLDRAWIRLKELIEADPDDVTVLSLTARMFVARGWPNRARKHLERALALAPEDKSLQALWDQASQPPVEPDASLEDDEDPAVLLGLAERYLATGALLKGRSLLERLRREYPGNDRVDDLLWVLEGDFDLGEVSLSELADRYGPDLSLLADLAEDAEHTESVTLDELQHPPAKDSAAFPALFRDARGGLDGDTETETEVTRATSLADLDQLKQSVEDARRSAGIVAGEEDTQIRRIIRRDDRVDYTDAGDVHVQRSVPTDVDFDLGQFRQEMGVSENATFPESDLEGPLEEEDDDIVILTKREQGEDDVQMLEPDPTSESVSHPDAARFLAEAEHYRRLETERKQAPEEADPPPQRTRLRRPRFGPPASSTPVWLLVLTILLGIAAFFLFILVVVQYLAT